MALFIPSFCQIGTEIDLELPGGKRGSYLLTVENPQMASHGTRKKTGIPYRGQTLPDLSLRPSHLPCSFDLISPLPLAHAGLLMVSRRRRSRPCPRAFALAMASAGTLSKTPLGWLIPFIRISTQGHLLSKVWPAPLSEGTPTCLLPITPVRVSP